MEFIFSNLPPMKTSYKTFSDVFYHLLPDTRKLDIAVGYVSADSLIELKKTMELNANLKTLNLVIGMHYFDHFTKGQYDAAQQLNDFLSENRLGEVRLVTAFRYHGKLYSYCNDLGPFAGIIGSNNLSSIVDDGARVYESSILLRDSETLAQMHDFIARLINTSTKRINEFEIDTFIEENPLLERHELVKKVSSSELATTLNACTKTSFQIPISVEQKSSLNVYFGKGRESKNGLVKPRHWYEVELIVPKKVTSQIGYPKSKSDSAVFTVITDDGWSFKCKVSGDYNKNFRSEGDLKILGKWLKGRMESAGALKMGEPVTADTLKRYGRDNFELTQTTMQGTWFLNFGVEK